MKGEDVMPYCEDKFLRDVTISLGLRMITHGPSVSLSASVDICAHDGEDIERLCIWVQPYFGIWMNLTLWDDETVWFSVSSWSGDDVREYEVGFYPDDEQLNAEQIAEAFCDSVAASMRLCYEECPLPALRRIWHHEGSVKITGELRSAKTN